MAVDPRGTEATGGVSTRSWDDANDRVPDFGPSGPRHAVAKDVDGTDLQQELLRSVVGDFPKQSNREQLYALHAALTSDALALMKKKNVDYADADDPYENFRQFGRLGILVRMSDKLARLRNFEKNGKFVVEDEGLRDSIIDLINYAVLYYGYK